MFISLVYYGILYIYHNSNLKLYFFRVSKACMHICVSIYKLEVCGAKGFERILLSKL